MWSVSTTRRIIVHTTRRLVQCDVNKVDMANAARSYSGDGGGVADLPTEGVFMTEARIAF
jgi:hypothetical protein